MNWGKRIKLVFDKPLANIKPSEANAFRLKNAYDEYVYPIAISQGATPNELFLDFIDFNQIVTPVVLEFLGSSLSSLDDAEVDPFEYSILLGNLNRHGDYEYIKIVSVDIAGEIEQSAPFDGKGYMTEYVKIESIVVAGQMVEVFDGKGYMKEYIAVTDIVVAGTYAYADGTPV